MDNNAEDTGFFWGESDDDTVEFEIDIMFGSAVFEGEETAPIFSISFIETDVGSLSKLAGKTFSVTSIEEADERIDTFYLFEHEPFESYKLEILAITADQVWIQCKGVVVTDGYAKPYKTAHFSLDCCLPVIVAE